MNRTLGEGIVNSVIQTTDGGYAVTGVLTNSTGTVNVNYYLLIKTNSTGDVQWQGTYAGMEKDFCYAVVQTGDGGYAIGGWMWGTNGVETAIVKTDTFGNMQWTKLHGAGQGWSLTKTSDSGLAVAGTTLVKVDGTGNEQWDLNLPNQAYSVIQTQDGGYAVAGSSSGAWLAKIDVAPDLNSTIQNSSPTLPLIPTPSVTPSTTIPEFPSLIVLPLAMIPVFLAVAASKRKKVF